MSSAGTDSQPVAISGADRHLVLYITCSKQRPKIICGRYVLLRFIWGQTLKVSTK